jgi:hypothetical protein
MKLQKKTIMDIITTLEEEIEVIAVDDNQLVSGKTSLTDANRGWKFVLPGRYLLAIVAFYIVNVVKVYFVVSHVDSTVKIPAIYDVSDAIPSQYLLILS